jgi:RNA polymerase sigma factor (sigma-70 family)
MGRRKTVYAIGRRVDQAAMPWVRLIRGPRYAVEEFMHALLSTVDAHDKHRAARPAPYRRVRLTLVEPEQIGGARLSAMIVAIARDRDRAAFAGLFEHFAPRVKSYMLRLGAASEAAEELAQETLLIVWRRAEAYDPAKAAASTWIFAIARNLRIDVARRANRAPLRDDPAFEISAPTPPDAAFSAVEDEARIGQAIATLPPEQARVIKLSFFSDKPHSEIAAELELPLGTVKSRLRLAMNRLRALLEEPR